MSGRWILVAPLACAFVVAAAVFLTVDSPSPGVRFVTLAAMAAVAILMLLALRGDRGGG